jgi:hypothetical protein
MHKSKSAPKADKKLTSRGYPELRHVSVPGYNKGKGTPGWVSGPARAAERKAK